MEMLKEFKRSVKIMDALRGRNGCPWDKEQTARTLKKYIIEEAFELVEALERGKKEDIVEELGDLFFQILFQARIAKERDRFGLYEVFKGLNEKMTRRHPHVFGRSKGRVKTAKMVLVNWTASKRKEGKRSVLDGVPRIMPALLRAFRITEKASTVGFDWRSSSEIVDKLDEEVMEFKKALKGSKVEGEIEHELGDMLFTLVNLSRFLGIDPESALNKTSDKFTNRFHFIEESLRKEKKDIRAVGIDKMEDLWRKAKARKL